MSKPVTRTAAGAYSATISVSLRQRFWRVWAEIAIEHEQEAREARKQAEATEVERGPEFKEAFYHEMQASMVAVSAAAHALDAFYGAIRYLSDIKKPSSPKACNRPKRQSQILETLKHNFSIGKLGHKWKKGFDDLFELRDAAVHSKEEWKETQPHALGMYLPLRTCTTPLNQLIMLSPSCLTYSVFAKNRQRIIPQS